MTVETDAGGTPTCVKAAGGRADGQAGENRVECINEAWRIDDEWWRQPINRRYFDVALDDGGHVVLFEDVTSGTWFMQQP